MIHNDVNRSLEFITRPTKAGKDALAMPLSPLAYVSLHFLGAVMVALAMLLVAKTGNDYFTRFIDAMSAELGAEVGQAFREVLGHIQNSPLVNAVSAFLVSIVFWVALVLNARVFGADVDFHSAMSAGARFAVVTMGLRAIFLSLCAMAFLMSESMGSLLYVFYSLASILIFIVGVFVVKGMFELKSFWRALGLTIIAGLAMMFFSNFLGMLIS